jgi:hypothetical protein
MSVRAILMLLAIAGLAAADTLTLRNGKTVQGTYLGGTARQIRMAVGDRIETYDVSEVASLQFEAPPASTPAKTVARMAPAAPAAEAAELPAGTTLVVRMIDSVDSQVNRVGETFRASLDEPVVAGGKTLAPAGAEVTVKLVELKEPGRLAGGGQLTLDLESITVEGKKVALSAGEVTQAGRSRTGESAKVIGGVAALGAIIGAVAGGGRGAAIGAASGAGAGTAIQVLTSGPRVRIPSETRLTFTLQQAVRL